jgi:hypothetical protein
VARLSSGDTRAVAQSELGSNILTIGCTVVEVRIDHIQTAHQFAVSFASIASDETPSVAIHIRSEADLHVLSIDGEPSYRSHDPSNVVDHLIAWCNQQAVLSQPDNINLHAAALSHPGTGRVVLVPGSPGAGKTTTAAAACLAGWGYLSDELVSIDRAGMARGYAKPLTIKMGTRPLIDFDEHRWTSSPQQRRWYLPPSQLGGHVIASGLPHAIMFTDFAPSEPQVTVPVGLAESVLELATNCQAELDPDGAVLLALARMAASSHTVRVIQNHRDDAVSVLASLAARPPAQRCDVGALGQAKPTGAADGPCAAPGVVGVVCPDGVVVHQPCSI